MDRNVGSVGGRNFGEIALACAIIKEKGYTDIQIANRVGMGAEEVSWLAKAGHDAVLRAVLFGCDSVDVYTKLMCSSMPVRKATIKAMGCGMIDEKLLAATTVLVGRRAKRNEKRKGKGV